MRPQSRHTHAASSRLNLRLELLSFPEPLSRVRPEDVESHLRSACAALGASLFALLSAPPPDTRSVLHNSRTLHLQKLLLRTGRLLAELRACPTEGVVWQGAALHAGNGLVLCQVLLKFAAERVAGERMRRLVADVLTDGGASDGREARAAPLTLAQQGPCPTCSTALQRRCSHLSLSVR